MSDCKHDHCQENGHCILDALWLNPPEFDKPELIAAAATIQEEHWKKRRVYLAEESAVVSVLWSLVEAAQDAAPGGRSDLDESSEASDVGNESGSGAA